MKFEMKIKLKSHVMHTLNCCSVFIWGCGEGITKPSSNHYVLEKSIMKVVFIEAGAVSVYNNLFPCISITT